MLERPTHGTLWVLFPFSVFQVIKSHYGVLHVEVQYFLESVSNPCPLLCFQFKISKCVFCLWALNRRERVGFVRSVFSGLSVQFGTNSKGMNLGGPRSLVSFIVRFSSLCIDFRLAVSKTVALSLHQLSSVCSTSTPLTLQKIRIQLRLFSWQSTCPFLTKFGSKISRNR